MRITEAQLRQVIRETLLNEIDIEDVGESCWSPGSTHELSTCTIGDDKFYLKFSTAWRFDTDDPSLQILNEYLTYQIYKQFPGAATPGRIEIVYDRSAQRVGLATLAVRGGGGQSMTAKQVASLLSAGVYVDIFLANWDVSNPANVIISPEEDKATRIDLGGNLDFRAQGKRKGHMFGEVPGELETMLPTTSASMTNVFDGADLRVAAQTFLETPWTTIRSVIARTHTQVAEDLAERGMTKLAGEWDAYVNHISPILAKRHRAVAAHAQHILET